MKITILTLFPNLFDEFVKTSIVKKIIEKKIVEIKVINFRDYSTMKNKQVDDYQYGGGGGMVLMIEPIVACIRKHKINKTKVFLLSPQGNTYTQEKAQSLANEEDIILICGHYEGFDERILNYVDGVISIGDYIMIGGECGAMVIVETIIRLKDGSINKKSLECESFDNNLLDYSCYTKPQEFEGYKVPEVLLSGNKKKIDEFRKNDQITKTKKMRPDLMKK